MLNNIMKEETNLINNVICWHLWRLWHAKNPRVYILSLWFYCSQTLLNCLAFQSVGFEPVPHEGFLKTYCGH